MKSTYNDKHEIHLQLFALNKNVAMNKQPPPMY